MNRHSSILPKMLMRMQKIKYGKNLTLHGFPIVHKSSGSKIEFGDFCNINSSILSNLIGLYQRTIIVARPNAEILIGNNVGLSGATVYARKKIVIGDNCLIGANVKIIDNDFHPLNAEKRLNNDKDAILSKEIIIGNNVFIGCNSIILKGTVIGDNVVIGAGSVVSGHFEPNCVGGGNPCRVIKSAAIKKKENAGSVINDEQF